MTDTQEQTPTLEQAIEALRQIDAELSENDAQEAKERIQHAETRKALQTRRSAAKKLFKTLARKV